jgi:hypothetical protein
MFQRRASAGRAALVLLASALLLSLPFAPARDDENLRLLLDWRPELEPLLLLGVVALLALLGRRLPTLLRWLVAAVLVVAAALQFADAVVLSLLDRELDLYFDLPHVPSLVALFYDAAGPLRGAGAIAAASIATAALIALAASALAASAEALRPPRRAAAALAIIAAALISASVVRGESGEPLFGERALPAIERQAARLYRAYAVTHGFDHRYEARLGAPQPAPGGLPQLRGRDVYLVFFESYGTVALDNPAYAAAIVPALAAFARQVESAGWALVSSRIVSPTFGGGSWLAHGTIDAGLRLDPLLMRLVLDTQRQTLPRYMRAAGYRSIELAPGLKSAEPEHAFWGFERSYRGADLGYEGPPFGWFGIPDQFTLRRLDAIADAPGERPLFAQVVLVSSHTPFAPVPPFLAEWHGDDPYSVVPPAEWARVYAPPDWAHLERPYVDSIVYDLKTLGDWLARRRRNALVVILGDHQPPGFVAGEKQPWTVPIHVLSRDPGLLRPFAALGYVAGALPPADGDFKGMESFLDDFLAAFAPGPSLATHAQPEERGTD